MVTHRRLSLRRLIKIVIVFVKCLKHVYIALATTNFSLSLVLVLCRTQKRLLTVEFTLLSSLQILFL